MAFIAIDSTNSADYGLRGVPPLHVKVSLWHRSRADRRPRATLRRTQRSADAGATGYNGLAGPANVCRCGQQLGWRSGLDAGRDLLPGGYTSNRAPQVGFGQGVHSPSWTDKPAVPGSEPLPKSHSVEKAGHSILAQTV